VPAVAGPFPRGLPQNRADPDNNFVSADNGPRPSSPGPTKIGTRVQFDLITNADGTISFGRANNNLVTAENA
jgi:hypothetical protein